MSDIAGESVSAVRLLTKALRALPEDEEATVLAFLLDRAPVRAPAERVAGLVTGTPFIAELGSESGYSARGPLRTMPVRLPEQHYERLKAWSETNNFPMAVIVRGLVERFLDEQDPRPT